MAELQHKRKAEDPAYYDKNVFKVESEEAADIPKRPFNDHAKNKKEAEYGVLEQLAGTWVSHVDKTGYGIHTTCMPSPGTTPEQIPGIFHFLCENYTEELKFTLVEGPVRNRAGTNEQMVGAVKYEQSIKNESGKPIHEENGMYMYLGDMYHHPASCKSIKDDVGAVRLKPGSDGQPFVPKHKLSRSGTIPHGSSILLLGENGEKQPGPPPFKSGIDAWEEEHLAISRSMGGAGGPIDLDQPAPAWAHDETLTERAPDSNYTYTQRIVAHKLYPCSVRPDLRLRDAIKDQNVQSHTFIQLDTEFNNGQGDQGGILNTPLVNRNTPISKMTLRMWIEEVVEDGETILQLQYEQVMFFQFGFGAHGGVTLWPHIQVNTLRKKPDEPADGGCPMKA